jgi:succinate dehydrogenase/fumarate reductase flavoprotein subunit
MPTIASPPGRFPSRHLHAPLLAALAALLVACEPAGSLPRDADVIVVGAGISGLAAALEAERYGARVLVVDMNSVAGGHAVKAGGLALVDTPLQQSKGYSDSPDIAFRDLMAWGENADSWWVRHYVTSSRVEVHDWLAGLGVRFGVVLDTPEDTVPRFHFARGAAVNVVVPMLQASLERERIEFLLNTEVTELLRRDGRIDGVRTRRLRGGGQRAYRAPAVIIATGGYQNDLARVRATWRKDVPLPARLLSGAGENARGSGLDLAERFGAVSTRLDSQVTFVNGLPDPRDGSGDRGLLVQNPAALWVDATGRRFTNESAPSKVTDLAVLRLEPATHWLIFDAGGARQLTIRGAAWLGSREAQREILDNAALVKRADSVEALAEAAGLPVAALVDSVERYNRFVEQGLDTDFGRVGPGSAGSSPPPLRQAPYYAVQLYPMTRKSMGGLRVDRETRVLGGADQPLLGLYAAGEVTGVAGINGRFGGSGTFLGPSVLMGRMAGKRAAVLALGREELDPAPPAAAAATEASPAALATPAVRPDDLAQLVAAARPGYWHFTASHALVMERELACATCHQGVWPPGPARDRAQKLVQTQSCVRCH